MKFVLSARDLSGWTYLLVGSLVVTGCTLNISGREVAPGYDATACRAKRSPYSSSCVAHTLTHRS